MKLEVVGRSALAAAVLSASALAQEPHAPMAEPKASVVLPEGKESVSVPFLSRGNHVVLPVLVNGSPLSLVLDTGMPGSGVLLYENEKVKKLGLSYGATQAQVGGAGGSGQRLAARVADGLRVQLGELALDGMRAIVLPPIPTFPNADDGIIGAALFRALTVRVDQDAQRLELSRPGTAQPRGRAVPITLEHNMPYATAEVVMSEGAPAVPVTVVVDMGAMHALTLNPSSSERIAVPANALTTRLGRGVSGAVDGKVGRIASLALGGQTLRNVVTGFPGKPHESPRGADSRNGNLGMGVLRQLNVTFDYAARTMYVEPSRNLGDAFEWDMSGLVLDPAQGGGIVVESVLAGTPAEEAGLKAGDRVLRFGGEAVSGPDVIRIRDLLRREGGPVELTVQRGEETKVVTLKPRRLV